MKRKIMLIVLVLMIGFTNSYSFVNATTYDNHLIFYESFERPTAPYDEWDHNTHDLYRVSDFGLTDNFSLFHPLNSKTTILTDLNISEGIIEVFFYDENPLALNSSNHKIYLNPELTEFMAGGVDLNRANDQYSYNTHLDSTTSTSFKREKSWHNFTYVLENGNLSTFLDGKTNRILQGVNGFYRISIGENKFGFAEDTGGQFYYDDISLRPLNTPSPITLPETDTTTTPATTTPFIVDFPLFFGLILIGVSLKKYQKKK